MVLCVMVAVRLLLTVQSARRLHLYRWEGSGQGFDPADKKKDR